jgi:hypothetical protein
MRIIEKSVIFILTAVFRMQVPNIVQNKWKENVLKQIKIFLNNELAFIKLLFKLNFEASVR